MLCGVRAPSRSAPTRIRQHPTLLHINASPHLESLGPHQRSINPIAMTTTPALPWSTRLTLSHDTPASLTGDKIHLPASALEALLSAARHLPRPDPTETDPWARPLPREPESLLPHPLILRLTNPRTFVSTYCVPREFSAEQETVAISPFLRKALGINDKPGTDDDDDEDGAVVLELEAAVLPKGTSVKLRPLHAYDEEDWEPILERYLRERFATVSEGLVWEVPRGNGQVWRFLVDKATPDGAVCVIDTDLEIIMEPLDEAQAVEALRRKALRQEGGKIAVEQEVAGEVGAGQEVFWDLDTWDRTKQLEVVVESVECEEGEDVDIFISTDRQHHRPRIDEHVWGNISTSLAKRITIAPTNTAIADAATLKICIRGWHNPASPPPADAPTRAYTLRITQTPEPIDLTTDNFPPCPNCRRPIPPSSLPLHSIHCARNNTPCPLCPHVSARGSPKHNHCATCATPFNGAAAGQKHLVTAHELWPCPACSEPPQSLPHLAQHRTTTCPAMPHICTFCHLLLPRGPDSPESTITGLSAHELECGARTTDCGSCGRRVRLRDMSLHMQHHNLSRLSRPAPTICNNPNCCRTLKPPFNELQLCEACFGPLYAPGYDPDGKALRRRLERRLVKQRSTGCGRKECQNPACAERAGKMSVKDAMQAVKGAGVGLCVDRRTEEWRALAEGLSIESAVDDEGGNGGKGKGGWGVEWCVAAVEAAGGDVEKARRWLEREGVRVGERG